jgi:hypothetical protein
VIVIAHQAPGEHLHAVEIEDSPSNLDKLLGLDRVIEYELEGATFTIALLSSSRDSCVECVEPASESRTVVFSAELLIEPSGD